MRHGYTTKLHATYQTILAAAMLATLVAPVGLAANSQNSKGYFSEAPSGGGIRALRQSILKRSPARSSERGDRQDDARTRESETKTEPATRNEAQPEARGTHKVTREERSRTTASTKSSETKTTDRRKVTRRSLTASTKRSSRSHRDRETKRESRREAKREATNGKSEKEEKEQATKKSETPRSGRPFHGIPPTVEPTPKTGFRYSTPAFYRGIYITSPFAHTEKLWRPLLDEAKAHGINTLVVDVQPKLPPLEFIRHARTSGFYLVSRVVVFDGGLKVYPPPRNHIDRVLDAAEESAKSGFMEVQFDYIRFADRYNGKRYVNLSLKQRYATIESILKQGTERLRPLKVRVGADIFGRIAFNNRDIIAQQVELFSVHLDTLYPMLYPSHFYGERYRQADPYRTILEGQQNCIKKAEGRARIIAYIQGFKMKYRISGLSYTQYIQKQIKAAEDSGGAGYVVWNARNKYDDLFRAIRLNEKIRREERGRNAAGQTPAASSR